MQVVSIIVPVYNEAAGLRELYRQVKAELARLDGYDHELIFVDDGSRDGSVAILRELAADDPAVRVIEFVRNFGKEAATTAGLHACSGDAAIMIDADLQHPPALIPELVARWERGADVVVGVRRRNDDDGWFTRLRSRLFYRLLNLVAEMPVTPHGTDFRLLDRAVIDAFNGLTERGRITRGLIDWLGFPTDHVEFDAASRSAGDARYSTLKLVRLAAHSFVSLSLFPLRLAGYLGVAITVLSGALGLFMYVDKYHLGDPWGFNFSGTAFLAVSILFLVGIVLSCLGLIALYIGHIHAEVLGRPLYVLRRASRDRAPRPPRDRLETPPTVGPADPSPVGEAPRAEVGGVRAPLTVGRPAGRPAGRTTGATAAPGEAPPGEG